MVHQLAKLMVIVLDLLQESRVDRNRVGDQGHTISSSNPKPARLPIPSPRAWKSAGVVGAREPIFRLALRTERTPAAHQKSLKPFASTNGARREPPKKKDGDDDSNSTRTS